MSSRRPLVTKIIYITLIAVLLIPLSWMSRPATMTSDGTLTQGGKLAQLRADYKLSQSTLGDIDPTSETIRLASLGMRGVAANILWHKANHYKKVEDWTNLSAAVEQITKLQPNFFKVWDFQAHNLSYNISTQFDDYRDRYKWVIKGIEFFEEGQKYNSADPRFENKIGWTIGHKIGRADEKVQYRRLFKADDDYHQDRRPQDRDNWLVAYDWFKAAERNVVDPALIRGSTPVLFFSEAAKALINYGEALETDGRFGDVAKTAWQNAADEFIAFGQRIIPTSFGINIQLENMEADQKRAEALIAELDSIVPGGRDQVREKKMASLSERERVALETPAHERTGEQFELVYPAQQKVAVSHAEVAALAPEEQLVRAREIAAELAQLEEEIDATQRYRDIVNYEYWRARSKAGFDDDWQKAQENMFRARESLKATQFSESLEAYETSFKHWRVILDRYQELREEAITLSDLAKDIQDYRRLLSQADLPFPSDFILQDVLDEVNKQPGETTPPSSSTSDSATSASGSSDPAPADASSEAAGAATETAEPPQDDAAPNAQPSTTPPQETTPTEGAAPSADALPADAPGEGSPAVDGASADAAGETPAAPQPQ